MLFSGAWSKWDSWFRWKTKDFRRFANALRQWLCDYRNLLAFVVGFRVYSTDSMWVFARLCVSVGLSFNEIIEMFFFFVKKKKKKFVRNIFVLEFNIWGFWLAPSLRSLANCRICNSIRSKLFRFCLRCSITFYYFCEWNTHKSTPFFVQVAWKLNLSREVGSMAADSVLDFHCVIR